MTTDLFVNIPTADLERAKRFFTGLGWRLDPRFTDENAAAVVIDDHAFLMVLDRAFYKGFIGDKEVGDPATTSLALIAFGLPSREAVDEFIERVTEAGGAVGPTQDYGFMYQRQFDDPDGNHFEPFWFDTSTLAADPSAAQVPEEPSGE